MKNSINKPMPDQTIGISKMLAVIVKTRKC
jgi:hypothetical protein